MITVYTMPKCTHCHHLIDYLIDKKIPYTQVDCATDQEKAKAIVAKTGQYAVPVTVVHEGTEQEKFLVGFHNDSMDLFLQEHYTV